MKHNSNNHWILIVAGMTVSIMLQANAGNIYWNGAGEDANWANPTNWPLQPFVLALS